VSVYERLRRLDNLDLGDSQVLEIGGPCRDRTYDQLIKRGLSLSEMPVFIGFQGTPCLSIISILFLILPFPGLSSRQFGVKTHESFHPGGSSSTGDGRESTAATSLPAERDFKCPEVAHSTGDTHELRIPAPKGGCTVSRARQRLAPDIGHSWLKQVSPQSACMP
jgi:hypothetical protein